MTPSSNDPSRISTLALWLDPSSGLLDADGQIPDSGEGIAQWTARDGQGRQIVLTSGFYPSWASLPSFKANKSPNGGPAVTFSGIWSGGGYFSTTSSLPVGRASLYSVFEGSSGSGSWQTLIDSDSNPRYGISLENMLGTGMSWPPVSFNNYDVLKPNIIWFRNGSAKNIYSAGDTIYERTDPAAINPQNLETGPFQIGCRMPGNRSGSWYGFPQCLNGWLSEMLIFSADLDERNHQFIVNYLNARHGFQTKKSYL